MARGVFNLSKVRTKQIKSEWDTFDDVWFYPEYNQAIKKSPHKFGTEPFAFKLLSADAVPVESFGDSVAVGGNRIFVGAYTSDNIGKVYASDLDGYTNRSIISASDGFYGDRFGTSVATDGTYVVVGAPGETNNTGAAYVYNLNGTGQIKITASDGASGDYFGHSVSVGGNKIVVGAYNANSTIGAVYIYNMDGTNEIKITPSDGGSYDRFGWSVSTDGNYIVVGSPKHNSTNGVDSGAAYVYLMDGTNEIKGISPEVEAGAQFGYSVAVGESRIVVGAPFVGGDDGYAFAFDTSLSSPTYLPLLYSGFYGSSVAVGNNKIVIGIPDAIYSGVFGAGRVTTFNNDRTYDVISQRHEATGRAHLDANPNSDTNDRFGDSVAVGSNKIVVCAPNVDNGGGNYGSAYTINLDGTDTTAFSPADPTVDDFFGGQVAIGNNKIVVSATGDDDSGSSSGSVYVHNLDGTLAFTLNSSDGTAGDLFGSALAIGSNKIVVGARGADDSVYSWADSGRVYVYNMDGTGEVKIEASDGAQYDAFGYSVASGSNKIVVGAPFDDDNGSASGSVYVYDLDGTNELKITPSDGSIASYFGSTVAVGNNKIVVASPAGSTTTGAVYVFNLDGTGQIKFTASDVANGDVFGDSVALSDSKIIVGAGYKTDNGVFRSGAVYVYNYDGTGEVKITPSDGAPLAYFGSSVSTDGNKIVVGAYKDDFSVGAIYIYNMDGTGEIKITAFDKTLSTRNSYGTSVAIGDNKIVVGASGDDDNGSNSGAIYVYDTNELLSRYNIVAPFETLKKENLARKLVGYLVNTDDNFGSASASGQNRVVISAVDESNPSPYASECGAIYIYDQDMNYIKRVIASDAYQDGDFGRSVAIGDNKIVVGAAGPTSATGDAYVYDLNGNNELKITANDLNNGDRFGISVAVGNNKIAVGAYFKDHTAFGFTYSSQGAVYVFNLDGTGQVKIVPSYLRTSSYFGNSLAIGSSKLVVGAYNYDNGTGTVFVYNLDGTGELKIDASDGRDQDDFGYSIATNGTIIVVGAPAITPVSPYKTGAVYIYNMDGTGEIKITPSDVSDGVFNDRIRFGYSVAISGDKIIVGAIYSDVVYRQGVVYIYDLDGTNEVKITAPDAENYDLFGYSVAGIGNKLIVGASSEGEAGDYAGAAYVYEIDSDSLNKLKEYDSNLNSIV